MTLNSPRAMLERLAFACFLTLLVGSVGLTGLGLIFGLHGGDPRPAVLGVAGLLVFAALRPLGYKHLHFREWEESFEPADGGSVLVLDPAREERAQALAGALEDLARLQEEGTRDVWAIQRLRHHVAELLAADPELREAFASELAGHPELGRTGES